MKHKQVKHVQDASPKCETNETFYMKSSLLSEVFKNGHKEILIFAKASCEFQSTTFKTNSKWA